MGAQLVSMALTRWAPHTPDRAFRVLIRMALTALDEATPNRPAALYFGGRDLLLSCMRAERSGTRKSVLRALNRAIDDLIQLGAIERTNRAHFGANQEYRLTLWNAIASPTVDAKPVDNSGEGDTDDRPMGDTHDHPMGDTSGTQRVTPTTIPRNQEEPLQELREEEAADLRGPVTGTRAKNAAPKPEPDPPPETIPKCPEPTCAKGWILTPEPPGVARCPQCNSNVIPFPADRRSA